MAQTLRGRWLDQLLSHLVLFDTCMACDPVQAPIHIDGKAIECPTCRHRWLGTTDLGTFASWSTAPEPEEASHA